MYELENLNSYDGDCQKEVCATSRLTSELSELVDNECVSPLGIIVVDGSVFLASLRHAFLSSHVLYISVCYFSPLKKKSFMYSLPSL